MTKEELYQEIKKLPNEMPSDKRLAAYFKGEIVDHQPCMMNAGQGVYAKMVGLANENVNDLEVQCEIIRRKELLYGMRGTRASMNLRTVLFVKLLAALWSKKCIPLRKSVKPFSLCTNHVVVQLFLIII